MVIGSTAGRQLATSLLTSPAPTMERVILTVLASWMGLAVLVALLVAALGRNALQEDLALGHVLTSPEPTHDADPGCSPSAPGDPGNGATSPLVASRGWVDAARHDR